MAAPMTLGMVALHSLMRASAAVQGLLGDELPRDHTRPTAALQVGGETRRSRGRYNETDPLAEMLDTLSGHD